MINLPIYTINNTTFNRIYNTKTSLKLPQSLLPSRPLNVAYQLQNLKKLKFKSHFLGTGLKIKQANSRFRRPLTEGKKRYLKRRLRKLMAMRLTFLKRRFTFLCKKSTSIKLKSNLIIHNYLFNKQRVKRFIRFKYKKQNRGKLRGGKRWKRRSYLLNMRPILNRSHYVKTQLNAGQVSLTSTRLWSYSLARRSFRVNQLAFKIKKLQYRVDFRYNTPQRQFKKFKRRKRLTPNSLLRKLKPQKLTSLLRWGPHVRLKTKPKRWLMNEPSTIVNFFHRKLNYRLIGHRRRYWTFWLKLRNYTHFRPFMGQSKRIKFYPHWLHRYRLMRFPMKYNYYKSLFYCPRFINYRRLYKQQIKQQQTFRWLFRLKTYKQLVSAFKKSALRSKRLFEAAFVQYFENRIDVTAYRLNFAFSLKQARQLVKLNFFQINNKNINWPWFQTQIGDVVTVNPQLKHQKFFNYYSDFRLFFRQLNADQYPTNWLINERLPAAIKWQHLNVHKLKYARPFSWQFLTLSLLKYR